MKENYDDLIGKTVSAIGWDGSIADLTIVKIDRKIGITTLDPDGDERWCINRKEMENKTFEMCFDWAIEELRTGSFDVRKDPSIDLRVRKELENWDSNTNILFSSIECGFK